MINSEMPSGSTLEAIKGTLKNHLPSLSRRYSVKRLGIFGAYVKGESRRDSDLDLLVEFDATPTIFEFVRLEMELANLLGVEVDLVMKTALKPEIGKHILSEVVPV
jgi:predicted nucleotidyltransferase